MQTGIPPQAAGPLGKSGARCERLFEEQIRFIGRGLDWIGFAFLQGGFRVYIEGLCGFLIFGDVS